VIDYAPHSEAAQDYREMADWLRSYVAHVPQDNRRARWSER
jgi:hypothetical protein